MEVKLAYGLALSIARAAAYGIPVTILAEKSKVPEERISKIERGLILMTPEDVLCISAALGIQNKTFYGVLEPLLESTINDKKVIENSQREMSEIDERHLEILTEIISRFVHDESSSLSLRMHIGSISMLNIRAEWRDNNEDADLED